VVLLRAAAGGDEVLDIAAVTVAGHAAGYVAGWDLTAVACVAPERWRLGTSILQSRL
jgi:hypothetical protein